MPYDYLIPTALFLIVLSGLIYHVGKYLPRGLVIIGILGIAFIPKFAALSSPYYGTEYEDAFVFQADSKSLAEHISEADPFRIQIAEYNFEKKENQLRSYTGHFTSFSALVWVGNKAFGYSRFRTIELNLLFSGLLFLMLYLTVYLASNDRYGALISILILATSPVINLFQTSGLAETYSSLMIAIFMYFAIRFWKSEKLCHLDTIFLIASLLLVLLIKRENMVLLSVLPFIGYRLVKHRGYWWISVLGVALSLYFVFVKPFSTEFLEASSIQASTFSFSYLLVQLPTYVAAFFKPQLYGVAFWILSLLVIFLIRNRSLPKPESLAVLGVFLGYLAIYSLHYRSRYFVLSMEMTDFETFRYANNFFFLIPLFIGMNLKPIVEVWCKKFELKYLTSILVIIFFVSVYFSQAIRTDFQVEEFQTRILPLLAANKLIRELSDSELRPVLVTDLPIVGKMLEANEFSVFVQEFQTEHDYAQYIDKDLLYFLVPKELAIKRFNQTPLKVIPLGIESHYVFYQLPF